MVHEDCLFVMPIHANALLLVLSWTPDAVDGYVGYIKLWLPVFHIGYFKSTITTLQCICKTCSSILLTEEDYRKFLRQFRHAFPGGTHSSIRMSPLISCCQQCSQVQRRKVYDGAMQTSTFGADGEGWAVQASGREMQACAAVPSLRGHQWACEVGHPPCSLCCFNIPNEYISGEFNTLKLQKQMCQFTGRCQEGSSYSMISLQRTSRSSTSTLLSLMKPSSTMSR